MGTCEGGGGYCVCWLCNEHQKVAHNGLYTPQGAKKDSRNYIGPVTRGNNIKRIGTLSMGEMLYI